MNLLLPRLLVGRLLVVDPVAVEVDDVGVVDQRQRVEHVVELVLLRLELARGGELHLVPHHLDALLGVHREEGGVDAGNVAVLNLQRKRVH